MHAFNAMASSKQRLWPSAGSSANSKTRIPAQAPNVFQPYSAEGKRSSSSKALHSSGKVIPMNKHGISTQMLTMRTRDSR